MAPSRPVLREHTKLIRKSARQLDRRRAAATAAEEARDEIIRDAFAAGVGAYLIHKAAGISIHRAYQINRGVR